MIGSFLSWLCSILGPFGSIGLVMFLAISYNMFLKRLRKW